jgi:hypothetical protein
MYVRNLNMVFLETWIHYVGIVESMILLREHQKYVPFCIFQKLVYTCDWCLYFCSKILQIESFVTFVNIRWVEGPTLRVANQSHCVLS